MNELNEAQHANRITTTTSIIWHWYIFRHHLALPSEADSHFRAVCRALVTEAVELTSFMEKVSSSNSQVETDSELGQLDIQDWVRICKYFSRIHFDASRLDFGFKWSMNWGAEWGWRRRSSRGLPSSTSWHPTRSWWMTSDPRDINSTRWALDTLIHDHHIPGLLDN